MNPVSPSTVPASDGPTEQQVKPVHFALIGTDTGVGKSHVTVLIARGLAARGRRVWLHKPVACGGWDGQSAEDSRLLRATAQALDHGQPPELICPAEFPEACSPHLAARLVGRPLFAKAIDAALHTVRDRAQRAGADLLVEGAGGLLSPLADDGSGIGPRLIAAGLPAVLICLPHLGTLNHTALTVNEARRQGMPLLGLVVNHSEPGLDSYAARSAPDELAAITKLPVLAVLAHDQSEAPDLITGLIERLTKRSMLSRHDG
jgi:dethiobiotin synthetase